MRMTLLTRMTAVCLLCTMAACTTWAPYQATPGEDLPKRIRVQLSGGEIVELRSPSFVGDSTIAGDHGVSRFVESHETILLREIEAMEQRQIAHAKTINFVGLTVLTLAAVGFVTVSRAFSPS